MVNKITSRMDKVVEQLEGLSLSPRVMAPLEEAADLVAASDRAAVQDELADMAAERMKLEAGAVTGTDRNNGVVLTIPIPQPHASRCPDPATHNRGHEPHLTALYVAPEMTAGEASGVLHLVRKIARTVPPFRLFVDAQSGLQSFGDTDDGEKALWLPARSEPRGELERLHRMLRQGLEREGVDIQAHDDFTPHVTWAYVPNDVPDEARRRMDAHVSDRFQQGIWFDVRHLNLSMPNGGVKAIALSPVPRSSMY